MDPTWLFLSLIPGGIGFVLFVYGKKEHKKEQRWPQLVAGLAFMWAALWLAPKQGW